MTLDVRVPMDPIFQAFGVPATITRPAPDDTPIATTAVWGVGTTADGIDGFDARRREWRRELSVRRDQVPTLPRGSIVDAPEVLNGTSKRWRVEGPSLLETELATYYVVYDPDVNTQEPEL